MKRSFCATLVSLVLTGNIADSATLPPLASSADASAKVDTQISSLLGEFALNGQAPVNLTLVAAGLLAQLSPERGVFAANATLGVTERSSFHMFATNRTETCHYHPGDTTSTVLWGEGRFYSSSTAPVEQQMGSIYFIPKGAAHAFGHVGLPTVVTVQWSPPFHENYTIPATGCIGI